MHFLQMTLTGAALIIVVALIRLAFGRVLPRRVLVLLWGIVLLRLIVPFPSLLGVALPQRAAAEPEPTAYEYTLPAPTAQSGPVSVTVPYVPAQEPVYTAAPTAPNAPAMPAVTAAPAVPAEVSEPTAAPAAAEPAARTAIPLQTVLKYVWLAGVVIAAAAAAILYASGYRRFKRAIPAEDGDARAWLEAHPLRRGLSLRRLEGLDSPLTYGVFRPVILIPEGFDLADGAAQLALEHEYVHARRFDPTFKLILTAALAVHWFNPFVWLMYFLAGRDVELACDEAVLRGLGEDGRADYARALLSMAERRSPVPALRVSFGSNRTRERIAAIMKFRKRSALAVVLAAVLTLGLAACAVTGPAAAKKLPDGVGRAVYDAVMEHNEGAYLRGEFACADVRILGFKTEDGRTTAYAMALYEEFKREDGEIKVVSGSHVPCAVTVEQGADGTCRAVEYREPRDGSLYADDIKAMFPRSLRSKLDTQKYIDEQKAACLAKAEAFYAGLTERLYCLTHERDAIWLVGLDGAEKVMELPEGVQTAAVAGSTLWYATEDELVRVYLADGSRREYALPENTWAGYYMYAEENAACIPLFTGEPGHASGAIYRFGDGGTERVTSGNVMSGTYPFAVDGRSIYYLTDGELLVREAPDGTVREFERPLLPLGSISVDGGRVYTAGSFGGCTSYDAATGGGERMETGAGGEIIHSCTAHGGWLYYPIGNPDMTGADDAALLMARRISDGKAVEYAKCTDAFTFYTLPFLVTFGEQGFVLDDGYQRDDFRYIPYYTADYTPTAVPAIDPEGYVISSREEMGAGFDPDDPAHAMNEEWHLPASLEELAGMSGAAVKAQLRSVDELDAMHCEYTFALIEDYFGTAEETISVTALKSSFLRPGGVYYLLLTVRSEPATEHRFYGFVTYRFLVREYLLDGEPLLYFLDGFDLGVGERDNMGVRLREIAASMRAAGTLPTVDTKTLEEALDEGGLVEIVTVTALREDVRDFFTEKYNVPFDFTVDEVLNGKTLIVPDGFPMLAPLGTQPGDRFILVFPKGAKSPREASNYLVFSVNSEEAKTILARYPSAATSPTPDEPLLTVTGAEGSFAAWETLVNEKMWTENGWLFGDGWPWYFDMEEKPERAPTVTLTDGIELTLGGTRMGNLRVYNEDFEPLREDWYGDTALNWLEPGTYWCVMRVAGPRGRYVPSEEKYEGSVYDCTFRLVVTELGPEPYEPGKAHDMVRAVWRYWRNEGGTYRPTEAVLTDPASLARLEELLSGAADLGYAAGCPFGSVVTATRADGTEFSFCPAEDSCGVAFAGGSFWRYAGDNEEFMSLFGVSFGQYEPTLAEDFTIGGAAWGSGYESVRALLGSGAEQLENGARLAQKDLIFFGQKVDVDYFFTEDRGDMRLTGIVLTFEKDFDKQAVVEGVSSVLGEIDKYTLTANGERMAVPEQLWKWHDEEQVGGGRYLHTAAFAEDALTGRPVLEFVYNGLWN